jgi:hypothetical protein
MRYHLVLKRQRLPRAAPIKQKRQQHDDLK